MQIHFLMFRKEEMGDMSNSWMWGQCVRSCIWLLAKDASLRRVDKVDGVDPTSAKLYFKLITVITYFKLITAT